MGIKYLMNLLLSLLVSFSFIYVINLNYYFYLFSLRI